jgi:hypothetical protein
MLAHGFTLEADGRAGPRRARDGDGGTALVGRPLRRAERVILDSQCQNTVMSNLGAIRMRR